VIGHVVSVSSPAEGDEANFPCSSTNDFFRPNNSHQNQSEGGCGIHGESCKQNTHRTSRNHADVRTQVGGDVAYTSAGEVTTTDGRWSENP